MTIVSLAKLAVLVLSLATSSIAQASALGSCGSTIRQRAGIPEYNCFSLGGNWLPFAVCTPLAPIGYKPVHFGEACKLHDSCYATRGASKSRCDREFRKVLHRTCELTLDAKSRLLALESCKRVADTAYVTVDRLGCDAFERAQESLGVRSPKCTGLDPATPTLLTQGPEGISDPNLTGIWVGTTTASNAEFHYEIHITQLGRTATGTVLISDPAGNSHLKYKFDGTVSGSNFVYRGTSVVERSGNIAFCMATGKLSASREMGVLVLRGNWGSLDIEGGCPRGGGGGVTLSQT